MTARVSSPGRWAPAFVAFTLRRGRLIWLVALLLAIPATWRTANLYLHLKSDLEELLPRDAPSVVAIDELRTRMPGLQYLGVVVDVGAPERLSSGERLVDDLAARIRAYPRDLARSVRIGTGEERAFFEAHAALYVDLQDLATIRARIEARRDFDVARQTGASLDDDEAPPSLDFTDIEKKYRDKLPTRASGEGDRYSSARLHLTMLLIEVGAFETGSRRGRELLSRVQSDVALLGGTNAYAKGMQIGYAGDVAISVEEMDALVTDLSLSSVVVLLAVAAVIVLYYRWWKSVLCLVPPLLLATVYAFALASSWPFGVTELNSNTAFLGSIIVGNGINFGIVLLARYVEERRRGRDVEDALTVGVWSARAGTLAAALGASVSYGALVLTQFRGFRQFGIIGGLGMVLSWAVAFVCMPSLVAWLDRDGSAANRPSPRARVMTQVSHAVERFRVAIVAAGVLLTLGAVVGVRRFGLQHLEYDFSKLRRADTWVSGEGHWGLQMDALLGQYLTPTVLLAESPSRARAIAARLKEEVGHAPLGEMVAEVRTLDDVLPPAQDAKIREASAIRADMTPTMRALLTTEQKDDLDRLLGDSEQVSIRLADLPRTFTTALVERDGTAGRAVLVYPRPSKALWEGPPLLAFVDALRVVAATGDPQVPPAHVAGSLPLSSDILASIKRDGPLASAAALGGVVLVVLVTSRRPAMAVYVIGALLVGVLWLAGATILFGVKINFANFIAFPITFGIGVDYAVNVVNRYVQDGQKDVGATLRATGSAVALCSLTTIIGYSSLLMAENRALFLFGLVAVLGEVGCLTAAVTFLPSVLLLVQRRRVAASRVTT